VDRFFMNLRIVGRWLNTPIRLTVDLIIWIIQQIIRLTRRHGPTVARATGRGLLATLEWSAIQLFRALRQIVREILRGLYRMSFGTWRRALVTLVVIGLVAAKYFPQQAGPIVGPLLQICIGIIGIRVMLIPFWPMGRQRRRR
jgi:hypothetical protein